MSGNGNCKRKATLDKKTSFQIASSFLQFWRQIVVHILNNLGDISSAYVERPRIAGYQGCQPTRPRAISGKSDMPFLFDKTQCCTNLQIFLPFRSQEYCGHGCVTPRFNFSVRQD